MKRIKIIERTSLLIFTFVAGALLSGCVNPMGKTSKYMDASLTPPASPPPGKTLVCIHRPREFMGCKVYTSVWDGTKLIAHLGNGHSVAYVCEPGQHYFMNVSTRSPACVEAQLLPDTTYNLWITNLRLKPIRQGDKMGQRVADLTKNNRWVTPASAAAGFEQERQENVRKLLEEFISGKRHDRLQHMGAEG